MEIMLVENSRLCFYTSKKGGFVLVAFSIHNGANILVHILPATHGNKKWQVSTRADVGKACHTLSGI